MHQTWLKLTGVFKTKAAICIWGLCTFMSKLNECIEVVNYRNTKSPFVKLFSGI